MEEEEHVQFEEEEFTTIYRKTKCTQSRKTKQKDRNADDSVVRTEIKLNPFLIGAKSRDTAVPDSPRGFRKSDLVQQLVKDTLNEYKGSDLPTINKSNRLFLAECEFDVDEAVQDGDDDDGKEFKTKTSVWRFKRTGRKVNNFV